MLVLTGDIFVEPVDCFHNDNWILEGLISMFSVRLMDVMFDHEVRSRKDDFATDVFL